MKQKQDYAHFGFLEIHSNLHTTTTSMLQILNEWNPPKFTEKFQIYLLAAILPSTLCV
jgi:hypothetical protein